MEREREWKGGDRERERERKRESERGGKEGDRGDECGARCIHYIVNRCQKFLTLMTGSLQRWQSWISSLNISDKNGLSSKMNLGPGP